MRTLLACVLVACLLVAVGCGPTNPTPPAAIPQPPAPPPAPAIPEPEPAPIRFSGKGKTATASFEIAGGLTVFGSQHTGSQHFAVQLLDREGNLVELLANVIGSYGGRRVVGLRAGKYVLNVAADGSWEIQVTQPRRPTTVVAPARLAGTRDDVAFLQLESGLHRFVFSHTGQGHFALMLHTAQGALQELLVNTVGGIDGSQAVRIPRTGLWVLGVRADGRWTVEVRR
jgi:hypothetical protein